MPAEDQHRDEGRSDKEHNTLPAVPICNIHPGVWITGVVGKPNPGSRNTSAVITIRRLHPPLPVAEGVISVTADASVIVEALRLMIPLGLCHFGRQKIAQPGEHQALRSETIDAEDRISSVGISERRERGPIPVGLVFLHLELRLPQKQTDGITR